MALKKASAPPAPKVIPLEKGFERAMFEISQEKVPVRLSLTNGSSIAGMIQRMEYHTVVMECQIDRFNAEIVYVPTNSVVYIAVEKPKEG